VNFTSLKQVFYGLILSWALVIGGCASDAGSELSDVPIAATDDTSRETCFDVTISSSSSSNTSSLCVTDENHRYNGLGVFRFVRFSVDSRKAMVFTVARTSGLSPADPDIVIYKNGDIIMSSLSVTSNRETLTTTLNPGDYVLQVFEDKYTLVNSKLSVPASKQAISIVSKFNQQESFYAVSPNCTSASNITLSGVVTYDLVPHKRTYGLDYDNISAEPVKQVVVELMCEGSVLSTTNTDDSGNYSFSAPSNILATVRVKAQMLKTDAPSYTYNVTVVDNTQSQDLYAMESVPFVIEADDIVDKNLHAQSGWTGSAYTSTRVAAPFAILDSVLVAMTPVIKVNPSTVFPELKINWSKRNISVNGDTEDGHITSSHYNGDEIFILGSAENDTDEYDGHVIIHEWGHYFEDKFSRSDSIGGEHTFGDRADIRVAFGEGFGNAYSAIASEDTIYRDTSGASQASGFKFDLDDNDCTNAGWYSECSVQSILYDLFDASNDGSDTVNLGFEPIYNILIDEQKDTPALTSIFSFIKELKDERIAESDLIDALVSGQNIDEITDIYGDSELTNNPGTTDQLPVFTQM